MNRSDFSGKQNNKPIFLDLFAGAGGLSEGFIQAGFSPLAHVEMDTAACFTLKTRMAFHWLLENGKEALYKDYLNQKITRNELYDNIPSRLLETVINEEICEERISSIFEKIDGFLADRDLDLIIGGPPCQAYSLVGRSRDKNRMLGDERNYLYKYYARFLSKYRPKMFIFENVLGLLSAKDNSGKMYFNLMKEAFIKSGYSIDFRVLSAENYGVSQNRKRIILIGKLGDHKGFYPELETISQKTTVNELFSDLPKIVAGGGSVRPCKTTKNNVKWLYDSGIKDDLFPVTFHVARPHTKQDQQIYRIAIELWESEKKKLNYNSLPENLKTHKHRNSFVDRFKVVPGCQTFSHTVVAHIAKDGHYYIHPDIEQNRSLSPREAARLQTFPDNYFFESISGKPSRTSAFKQIGNAVPPLLAKLLAKKIKENVYEY